jgi:hypothetical protein
MDLRNHSCLVRLGLVTLAVSALLLLDSGAAMACGAHATSSDTMSHHEDEAGSPDDHVADSHAMETVGSSEPIEAQSGEPRVTEASDPSEHEASSRDVSDLPYAAPQAGAAGPLELPDVDQGDLTSPEATEAYAHLKAAKASAGEAEDAYATMIRRDYPTGAPRAAIIERRDATRQGFEAALAAFEAAQEG